MSNHSSPAGPSRSAQESFRLAHGREQTAAVTYRVMNYFCFLNTKVLFKYMRHDAELVDKTQHVPVSCHVNYHPEKEARMVTIRQFYHEGRPASSLAQWNGGEGRNTGTCRDKVGVQKPQMTKLTRVEFGEHKLAQAIVAADVPWTWAAPRRKSKDATCRFLSDGTFESSWGSGSWGTVPSPWRKDSLHVTLDGEQYLLMFLSEKWAFVALRCSDEEVTHGSVPRSQLPSGRLKW